MKIFKNIILLCLLTVLLFSHTVFSLQVGDNSLAVKYLQKWLQIQGYLDNNIEADGNYGPKTRQAVKDFQKAEQLKPTGVFDDKAEHALMQASEAPENKENYEDLQKWQEDAVAEMAPKAAQANAVNEAMRNIAAAEGVEINTECCDSKEGFNTNQNVENKNDSTSEMVGNSVNEGPSSVSKDFVEGVKSMVEDVAEYATRKAEQIAGAVKNSFDKVFPEEKKDLASNFLSGEQKDETEIKAETKNAPSTLSSLLSESQRQNEQNDAIISDLNQSMAKNSENQEKIAALKEKINALPDSDPMKSALQNAVKDLEGKANALDGNIDEKQKKLDQLAEKGEEDSTMLEAMEAAQNKIAERKKDIAGKVVKITEEEYLCPPAPNTKNSCGKVAKPTKVLTIKDLKTGNETDVVESPAQKGKIEVGQNVIIPEKQLEELRKDASGIATKKVKPIVVSGKIRLVPADPSNTANLNPKEGDKQAIGEIIPEIKNLEQPTVSPPTGL